MPVCVVVDWSLGLLLARMVEVNLSTTPMSLMSALQTILFSWSAFTNSKC